MTDLEPMTPAEAKEMYLNARKGEVSESTLDGYHYRLKHFVRWCEDVEKRDNLNDLSGRGLQRFKTCRLLRINGWDGTWDWIKQVFGDEFNPQETYDRLSVIVDHYPKYDDITVPPQPSHK